jgi:hypothetical protein
MGSAQGLLVGTDAAGTVIDAAPLAAPDAAGLAPGAVGTAGGLPVFAVLAICRQAKRYKKNIQGYFSAPFYFFVNFAST